ncbi:MAG: Sua5/YciO/YrdC/YwlC family protein, partial [Bacteroidetes bacterium]|nr:Sua5/YciO/YrdC/YwlC family protein [Bacteroidota bacterium]
SLHHEDEILDYLTDPDEIYERFNNLVDIVIDSGHGGLIPSTVVDCTGEEPVVIREGLGDTGLLE